MLLLCFWCIKFDVLMLANGAFFAVFIFKKNITFELYDVHSLTCVNLVTNREDENWWEGTLNSKTGMFPATYVCPFNNTAH